MKRIFAIWTALALGWGNLCAQDFFNLRADEVRIDSVLPSFQHSWKLGADGVNDDFEVVIEYPEFIDMSPSDVLRYQSVSGEPLPEMPVVQQYVGVSRKEATLYAAFTPLVCRNGKYQKLVSFKLTRKPKPTAKARRRAEEPVKRYADHSVLATGQWAKIRVPETGIYQLTDALIRQAGFSNPSKVKVYGYGGALQPEQLTGDYLATTDDLKEVPQCVVNGRRLFYAVGSVNWSTATSSKRQKNNYSDYGYYFLTESDAAPLTVDSTAFASAFYPSANDYHSHYENDEFSWYHGGRNLYGKTLQSGQQGNTFTLPAYSSAGSLVVEMSYNYYCEATVLVNDSVVGTILVDEKNTARKSYMDSHSTAASDTWVFPVAEGVLKSSNTIVIQQKSGRDMRLDYLTLVSQSPRAMRRLSSEAFPAPEYVYRITNQDRHGDPQADMVIIIPTTQKFVSEAERLKSIHEQYDGLRVNVVPADELYNEFSSGTPDANAYRRYMKMLYDRAESAADMPRFLILFGDGAWDNRMVSTEWRGNNPDDLLLCYESENSFSETECYVSDDYFCLLDDGEGGNVLSDKIDVAVGRLTARTAEDAKTLVDKILDYRTNKYAGVWQNTLCFMGDDGDNNRHMQDAEWVAKSVASRYDSYEIKKIYWDAYPRETSTVGYRYPDVERLISQQMRQGALVMNYSGHGGPTTLSHERVVQLADFTESSDHRMALWVTAACDILPFDTKDENIGETAMLNKKGCAIAFYGTTHSVYANYNRQLNEAFMKYVLDNTDGVRHTIGEAVMKSKNEFASRETSMLINKQQYTLLGDPALVLAAPTCPVVVDEVNGQNVAQGTMQLPAGSEVTVTGHVADQPDFRGVVTVSIYDETKTVVGRKNDSSATTAFQFDTRPSTIYVGSDSIRNGRFTIKFPVPKDVEYSQKNGQMLFYAVNNQKTVEGHGEYDNFVMNGTQENANDGVGPSIYCYLNSESFVNGGTVNATPYFFAQVTDKDGINAAGNGIGHDMELIIDGELARTYILNHDFQYDFGDYRSGSVGYSIPALADGPHKLLFRTWDMLNNSSTAELSFTVDSKAQPSLFSVTCISKPTASVAQFAVNHDRTGSEIEVVLEVYDMSGRLLWSQSETGVPTGQTYIIDWDMTASNGHRLQTGVYLYRVLIGSKGESKASKAQKMIVIGNK